MTWLSLNPLFFLSENEEVLRLASFTFYYCNTKAQVLIYQAGMIPAVHLKYSCHNDQCYYLVMAHSQGTFCPTFSTMR
jgi:hypothetical protein